jgi:hypothetical protein
MNIIGKKTGIYFSTHGVLPDAFSVIDTEAGAILQTFKSFESAEKFLKVWHNYPRFRVEPVLIVRLGK